MIYNGKTLRYEEYWEDAMRRIHAREVWGGVFEFGDYPDITQISSQEEWDEYIRSEEIHDRCFNGG